MRVTAKPNGKKQNSFEVNADRNGKGKNQS